MKNVSSRIIKIFACVALAVILQLHTISISNASNDKFESVPYASEFDWVLVVEGHAIENFLNYPGSEINSMNKFTASFKETGAKFTLRGIQTPSYDCNKYEEFWYHDGRPIGQRRACNVPTPATEQGAIILCAQPNQERFVRSSANCLIRLFLEARLNQSIVAAIVVPQNLFEPIASELAHLNFLEVQAGTKATDGNVTVRLVSNPSGYERHFYYADHRQM
jgi:hypothetical protein